MRACHPVPLSLVSGASTTIHTWVDVELRVIGQHVAVNIKNAIRSWVHNLGPRKSKISFPGLVFSKVGWVPFGVMCWQINLGWLVSWKMLWNWCIWGYPLSVIQGLVLSLPCSRVPRLVAKPGERGFLFASIEWCLMIRRTRGRSLDMGAAGLAVVGLVAQRFWVANRGRGSARKSLSSSSSSSSSSQSREETSWETAPG